MLEGMPPHNPTHLMRLVTDEVTARRVADVVVEMFDPAETAAAAFENEATKAWEVEVYFSWPPDEDEIRALVSASAGPAAAEAVRFDAIGEQDWVRASLEGLAPVPAGRFLVHGSHDRDRAPANAVAIEIEAALAFGTGHHGTTRGCLLMLDGILKRRRPVHVLDVGTGTGVLAIAAARALRRPVKAGDIDPVATEAALANARHNRAGAWVRPVTARGLDHPALRADGAYDLILANILARPLVRLAPSIARAASPDADIVLSGLQMSDVPSVLAAYRAQGLTLARRIGLEGWATLLLRRGGASPRRLHR
jgi:ribosomal protein L11 methyltransferase